MPDRIRIIEVGPRDGLQNEVNPVPTQAKLQFIADLAQAGCAEIEATSFVSPKWVPQLADAESLWPSLATGPLYSALVPNERGLERALALGVNRIALFTASSESFVRRNLNTSVAESLQGFLEVLVRFREVVPGGFARAYVSTAFECPFEGRISPAQTVAVARELESMGADEISIGDTIGVVVPSEVAGLTGALLDELPIEKLAYHFHDTRGTALANVSRALDLGVRAFDSSAAGLGGCPYAPGAGGNLATEDLVYFLERSGIRTGIDLSALARASLPILECLGRPPSAKAQQAALAGLAPTQ